jgi:chromosome partitioning protein
MDLQSSIGVPTVVSEIDSVNNDVQLMIATIEPTLSYRPAVFAGAIGMMIREYNSEPKQSELEELRRLRRATVVFESYVTEGDGVRRAAQERVPVFDISGSNAAKQSQLFEDLTAEFLAKCP